MKTKAVRECLQPSAFADGKIPYGTIGTAKHVLASRHPMDPRLQRLGGFVERTAGVPGIGTSAGNKPMIWDLDGFIGEKFWIRQVNKGIPYRAPWQIARFFM